MVRVVRHVQEESEDLSAGGLLVIVATVEGVGAMVMVEKKGKWRGRWVADAGKSKDRCERFLPKILSTGSHAHPVF